MDSSNLRSLKSKLEERLNAKENHVAILQKKLKEFENLEASCEYSVIENICAEEENKSRALQKSDEYIARLALERELSDQIQEKKLQKSIEEAEFCIDSLTLKAEDKKDFKEVQLKRNKRSSYSDEIKKFNEAQFKYKEMETHREQERNAALECVAEQHFLLDKLKEEFAKQKKEKNNLEKTLRQVGLLNEIGAQLSQKETLQSLREEELSLIREKEEEEKMKKEMEERKKKNEHVIKEREEQIRRKNELRSLENQREQEYLQLLVRLLSEEEKMDNLREEVRRRKKLEHHAAAQKVLEERRRRKKKLALQEALLTEEENKREELSKLVMEEEEKRLLLQYVPHLGPFLSQDILRKLSVL